MKILIMYYLLSLLYADNYSDGDKYAKAYKMIQDSSIVYQHFFNCYDPKYSSNSFKICVSNKTYFMDKTDFIYDIIEYEHNKPEVNSFFWKHIRDSLSILEYNLHNKYGIDTNYKEISELKKMGLNNDCDLKLFFGDFDSQNRLRASLIYNNNNEDFRKAFRESKCGIDFLFYFKNDDIIKVMIQPFER